MTDRERASKAGAHVRELDAALADLLRALDRSFTQSPETARDPAAPVSTTQAAEAVRRLVASFPTRLDPGGHHDGSVVATRARGALDELARHAKAEHRRSTLAAANADEWERNAKLAVRAGDDDLARQALAHRAECTRAAALHARHAALLDEETGLLAAALDGLGKLT